MRIKSEKEHRDRQAFKAMLREIFTESPLSQEGIADAVDVTQPTVHRWLSYQDNELPDLYQFSKCPPEFLQPVCAEILKPYGIVVTRRIQVHGPLNADVSDEITDMLPEQHILLKKAKTDPKAGRKALQHLQELCARLDAELTLIESRRDNGEQRR